MRRNAIGCDERALRFLRHLDLGMAGTFGVSCMKRCFGLLTLRTTGLWYDIDVT